MAVFRRAGTASRAFSFTPASKLLAIRYPPSRWLPFLSRDIAGSLGPYGVSHRYPVARRLCQVGRTVRRPYPLSLLCLHSSLGPAHGLSFRPLVQSCRPSRRKLLGRSEVRRSSACRCPTFPKNWRTYGNSGSRSHHAELSIISTTAPEQ
jgi:hypothetical protein